MTEKTVEWYQKELADRFTYFYYQTDGTFNFPNSAEGDLLKMTQKMLNLMKSDHQPTFAVGEYYTDDVFIYKIRKVNANSLNVDYLNKQTGDFVVNEHWSLWIPTPEPATAEQIATFKRAEHFASKGRKLDEFRVGDKISLSWTDKTIKIESLRGGAISGMTDLGDSYSISLLGGPTVTLIQTAEELQNGGNSE